MRWTSPSRGCVAWILGASALALALSTPARGASPSPGDGVRRLSGGSGSPQTPVANAAGVRSAPKSGWKPYDYEKAKVRAQGVSSGALVVLAYLMMLVTLVGYVLVLARRQRHLAEDFAALRRKSRASASSTGTAHLDGAG